MTIGALRLGPVALSWADSSADLPPDVALDPAQARRRAGMPAARAASFATGRHLLAGLAARLAPGEAFAVDSTCATCGEDHGRPRSVGAPLVLSVAYAGTLVVAAAALRGEVEAVGVDVERAGGVAPDLAALFPRGAPDLAGWTRLEAVLKADGRGIRVDPSTVEVRTGAGGPLLRGGSASVPGRSGRIEVATIAGPADHVMSVAVIPAGR